MKPIAVALVLSVALAACGGSPRLSKSAYERSVHAIGMKMFVDYQAAFHSSPGRQPNIVPQTRR